jgi:Flp pilus assembly protein TadG
MRRFPRLARRFAASNRGLAAVEFAMIVPILLIMLLTTFDAGRAIAAYMKVRAAAFTLAAITNQYTTGTSGIASTNMTEITGSSSAVLAPYTGTTVARVTQVKATSLTAATVSWSYATDGSQYTTGATWTTMPSQFKTTSACNSFPCYYIFSEIKYTYTPTFGYFLTGSIILQDNVYATPRSSTCIQYLSVPATC